MKKNILYFLTIIIFASCKDKEEPEAISPNSILAPIAIQHAVIKIYPHDTSSYTQGLFFYNNKIYEGTGWYQESKLMIVDLNTGKTEKKIQLADSVFGEGITMFNNKIYQLTWQNHKVYVYDAITFKKEKEFEWPFEGWGLTHNDSLLIISTGDSNLYFVNPATFKIERTVGVSDNNGYIDSINELEYVNGSIYANKYMTDIILKINPQSGIIEGKVDLSNLLKEAGANYDPRTIDAGFVLNGIAYNQEKKSFYLTGKRWPFIAEVKFN